MTMGTLHELASLEDKGEFIRRHIGPSEAEIAAMLKVVGADSLEDLAARTVPARSACASRCRCPRRCRRRRRSRSCARSASATKRCAP
jgi:glycine cleavage system pyridoxal-binding protein P